MNNVNDTLIFKLWNSNSKLPNRKGKKFLTDKMDDSWAWMGDREREAYC